MRTDLKSPCKNCPFRTDATAIRFACRERAEEIEESAFRNGFPCHLSASYQEVDSGESDGYVPRADGNTQHCVGAIIMWLNDGFYSTPGLRNDDDLFERLSLKVNYDAPVFESVAEFLDANTKAEEAPTHSTD